MWHHQDSIDKESGSGDEQDYNIYFTVSMDKIERASERTWRLFESCELPLVEKRQRCNITWIFLQVFNQTKKRKKDGTFSQRCYRRCSSWSDKTSVSVLVKWKVAITSVSPIGLLFYYHWGGLYYYVYPGGQYWLPVQAQFTVFISWEKSCSFCRLFMSCQHKRKETSPLLIFLLKLSQNYLICFLKECCQF